MSRKRVHGELQAEQDTNGAATNLRQHGQALFAGGFYGAKKNAPGFWGDVCLSKRHRERTPRGLHQMPQHGGFFFRIVEVRNKLKNAGIRVFQGIRNAKQLVLRCC